MSEVSENSDKDAEDYQHRLRAMMYKLPGGRNFIDLFAEIQWNEQSARTVTILSASWIEWRVTEAILTLLPVKESFNKKGEPQRKSPAERLMGLDGDTGMLTYEHKCLLAHALGIIDDIVLAVR